MYLNERARKWLPWLLLAVVLVATAAVYWPGVTGGWVFDDYPNIVDNHAIHITPGHSTLVAWIDSALSSPASFLRRPLASLTFSVNWYFGGGNPWPFKVTNIVTHLINGVLLFCMLRVLLRLLALSQPTLSPSPFGRGWREAPGKGSGLAKVLRKARTLTPAPLPEGEGKPTFIEPAAATRLALIVSAAWLLLPINLMAVLYVVQRMESLCQVFVLAGLWAYLHGRWMMLTAHDVRRDRHGFALATAGIVAGTLLGLTSKETAVLLPVFAFLAEWILLRFRSAGQFPAGRAIAGKGTAVWRGADEPAPPSNSFRDHSQFDLERNPEGSSGSAREDWIPGSARPERGQPRNDNDLAEPRTAEPIAKAGSASCAAPHSLWERGKQTDKRLWTLFTVTLFIPGVLGFLWLLRGAMSPAAWSGRDFTLGQRLLTELRVLVDYLHWTIAPNPMVLSLYHDEIVKSTGLLTPWTTLGSLLLLGALIVIAVLLRNRRPLVSLGIGWFFAAQLLTATIIPLELVYEQRMYFASIGVLLGLGALLLGRRWRIRLPLLRGFVVAVALLWFAVATNLRAQEWSNPLRLAVAEANRHPESPRAVYEAGRQLLIASGYKEGPALTAAWKYLREASAIPGSSALSDQAMIMIADHDRQGDDDTFWATMTRKLRDQPTRQEDISALISLTNCYGAGICKFDLSKLKRAYEAALSRPHPIARLDGAYAAFQRDILHNDAMATEYLERAVEGAPGESAYRVDLAALYARDGQTEKALEQIDALRRMNLAGRLDGQIATLERLAEQGKAPHRD